MHLLLTLSDVLVSQFTSNCWTLRETCPETISIGHMTKTQPGLAKRLYLPYRSITPTVPVLTVWKQQQDMIKSVQKENWGIRRLGLITALISWIEEYNQATISMMIHMMGIKSNKTKHKASKSKSKSNKQAGLVVGTHTQQPPAEAPAAQQRAREEKASSNNVRRQRSTGNYFTASPLPVILLFFGFEPYSYVVSEKKAELKLYSFEGVYFCTLPVKGLFKEVIQLFIITNKCFRIYHIIAVLSSCFDYDLLWCELLPLSARLFWCCLLLLSSCSWSTFVVWLF
mgnify:CR=1 FL=1